MSEKIAILFLEDETALRNNCAQGLLDSFPGEIDIFPAETPEDALDFLREQPIAIAIVDILMQDNTPGGVPVAAQASREGKYTIIYSRHKAQTYQSRVQGENPGPVSFVPKQATGDNLRDELGKAIRFVRAVQLTEKSRHLPDHWHHCFGWVQGTGIAMRFFVGEANQHELEQSRQTLTNRDIVEMYHLVEASRTWERIVRAHKGELVYFHGHSSFALFPDDEPNSGLACASGALKAMRRAADAEKDKVWSKILFRAGMNPGRYVNGLFGQRLPGHAAFVSRFIDLVHGISDNVRPMRVGTVDQWLTPEELVIVNGIGEVEGEIQIGFPGFEQTGFGQLPVVTRRLN